MRWCFVVFAVACHREPAPPKPVEKLPQVVVDQQVSCERVEGFAESTPVPEASAAAWFDLRGKPMLVVTSDSGNKGKYGVIDPDTGETVEQAKWPLGEAGQDVEGLASRGTALYGLTSSGYVYRWERAGDAFRLVEEYAIGDGDLVCDEKDDSNCGRNYEGLCLAAKPSGPCVGFAVAKAEGRLICVADAGGKLVATREHAIAIGQPKVVADCAFDDTDRLWVGSNIFDLNTVYRVDGWTAPETAKVVAIGAYGIGFSEVIAARGDVIYRMSDTGGSPSGMAKFRCAPAGR